MHGFAGFGYGYLESANKPWSWSEKEDTRSRIGFDDDEKLWRSMFVHHLPSFFDHEKFRCTFIEQFAI